jgi:hypothetical protein
MYIGSQGALVVGISEEIVEEKIKTTHICLFPPANMELTASILQLVLKACIALFSCI